MSDDEVASLAGDLGATAEIGGRRLNVSGLQGVRVKPPAPQSGDGELARLLRERLGPPPAAPTVDLEPFVEALQAGLGELAKQMSLSVARAQRPAPAPAPQIHVQPSPIPKPSAWRFEFEFDKDKNLVAMTATPR